MSAEPAVKSVWRRLDWLYLPPGYVPEIKRIVGLLLIWLIPETWMRGVVLGPYHVAAWRIGGLSLDLPATPPAVDDIVWIAVALSACCLLFGVGKRLPLVAPAVALAFYCSREVWACAANYVIMTFIYVVALLFDRRPLSCSRRIIQWNISLCYVFTALLKLHPEFIGGHTFSEMFATGWQLRDFFDQALHPLAEIAWLNVTLAVSTVVLELFLAVGFWFKKTRKLAFVSGIAFHLLTWILFDNLDIFPLVMFAGYLSFFDKGKTSGEGPLPTLSGKGKIERMLASAFMVVSLVLPARFYILPERDWLVMSARDFSPWGWNMFCFREEVTSLAVDIRSGSSAWEPVPAGGRMTQSATDSELMALAAYLLRQYPQADAVRAVVRLKANHHRQWEKEVTLERLPGATCVVTVRQASNEEAKPR